MNFRRAGLSALLGIVALAFTALPSEASIFGSKRAPRKSYMRKAAEQAFPSLRLPVEVPANLTELIREAGATHNVDPGLLAAVVFRESAFNSRAVSRRGAQGLMQLMPRTARYLGVEDAFDPRQNVMGGAKYLREMLDMFNGDVELSLAAYNAGPEAVKRNGAGATAEAVQYVAAIRGYYPAK